MLNRALVQLYARRGAPLGFVVGVAVLLTLLAFFAAPPDLSLVSSEDPASVTRAFRLQNLWAGSCLVILPVLVLRAAGIAKAWKTRDLDWLASRPVSFARAALATWVGSSLGAFALVVGAAVVIELAAGPGGDSQPLAYAGRLPALDLTRDESGSVRWTLADPGSEAGARLRVELALGQGSGPGADVEFRARRGEELRAHRTTMIARGRIELELPPGEGDVELELERIGSGARVLFRDPSCELWVPAASVHSAGWIVCSHAVIATFAWLALALGLGAWMSAPLASLALFSVWLSLWLSPSAPAFVPGGALPDVIAVLHEGRAPGTVSPLALVGLAVCVALGVALSAVSFAWKGREA